MQREFGETIRQHRFWTVYSTSGLGIFTVPLHVHLEVESMLELFLAMHADKTAFFEALDLQVAPQGAFQLVHFETLMAFPTG